MAAPLKSSIIFNWQEISSSYLHLLARNTVNHIIAQNKDKMMGGFAFIEDMNLGTKAPELHLESIDAFSENYAKAKVTFRYDSDLHVKAQAYQQINPLHYTMVNPPGNPGVRVTADNTVIKTTNAKVRRRGRMLMNLCESDYPSYINVWALVFDVKLEGALVIEYVNNTHTCGNIPNTRDNPLASTPHATHIMAPIPRDPLGATSANTSLCTPPLPPHRPSHLPLSTPSSEQHTLSTHMPAQTTSTSPCPTSRTPQTHPQPQAHTHCSTSSSANVHAHSALQPHHSSEFSFALPHTMWSPQAQRATQTQHTTPMFISQSPEKFHFSEFSQNENPDGNSQSLFSSVRPVFMKSLNDSMQAAWIDNSNNSDAVNSTHNATNNTNAIADAGESEVNLRHLSSRESKGDNDKNNTDVQQKSLPNAGVVKTVDNVQNELPHVYIKVTLLPYNTDGTHTNTTHTSPLHSSPPSPFPLKSVSISCSMDHSVLTDKILAKAAAGLASADAMLRKTGYTIIIPLPSSSSYTASTSTSSSSSLSSSSVEDASKHSATTHTTATTTGRSDSILLSPSIP